MPVELKVPSVGESITEVEIAQWLKQEGQRVEKDEPLVEIETDKVTVEVPAPVAGVVSRILKKQGEPASVGDVIGYMEEGAAEAKPDGAAAPAPKAPTPEPKTQAPATTPAPRPAAPADQGPARVMPAAQRVMAQEGINADQVKPTGPGGRILKEDVQREAESRRAAAPAPQPAAPAPRVEAGAREEEAVRMSPLRRRIAQRLVEAQQTAALLTTFNEIDMTEVMALRKKHQEAFQQRYGIKVGFMSFFVKAAVDALKQIPAVNAEIRGDEIVYRHYHDIGIAIGGGRGLVVPILRDADRMSFAEIELAIADFAKRAKDNKLELHELEGGTFTISNGGVYGSLLSTPIVNPPQSGILGLHAIQDRPVAIDGQVVIRPMMYVALTYDHRLVDGREAVTFLKRIKETIEEPARMLLEA